MIIQNTNYIRNDYYPNFSQVNDLENSISEVQNELDLLKINVQENDISIRQDLNNLESNIANQINTDNVNANNATIDFAKVNGLKVDNLSSNNATLENVVFNRTVNNLIQENSRFINGSIENSTLKNVVINNVTLSSARMSSIYTESIEANNSKLNVLNVRQELNSFNVNAVNVKAAFVGAEQLNTINTNSQKIITNDLSVQNNAYANYFSVHNLAAKGGTSYGLNIEDSSIRNSLLENSNFNVLRGNVLVSREASINKINSYFINTNSFGANIFESNYAKINSLNVNILKTDDFRIDVNVKPVDSSYGVGYDKNGKLIPIEVKASLPNGDYVSVRQGVPKGMISENEVVQSKNLIQAGAVLNSITNLGSNIQNQFTELNGNLENQFININTQFNNVFNSIGNINVSNQLDDVYNRFNDVSNQFSDINNQFNDVNDVIANISGGGGSIDLPNDCDYVSVEKKGFVPHNAATEVEDSTNLIQAGAVLRAISGFGNIVNSLYGTMNDISNSLDGINAGLKNVYYPESNALAYPTATSDEPFELVLGNLYSPSRTPFTGEISNNTDYIISGFNDGDVVTGTINGVLDYVYTQDENGKNVLKLRANSSVDSKYPYFGNNTSYLFKDFNKLNSYVNLPFEGAPNLFVNCPNLNVMPNLARIENAYGCFKGCNNFNQPINLQYAKDCGHLLYNAKNFSSTINIPLAENISYAFFNINNFNAYNLNMPRATVANYAFASSNVGNAIGLKIPKLKTAYGMFANSNIYIDTNNTTFDNVVTADAMFDSFSGYIGHIPEFPNVMWANNMFNNCKGTAYSGFNYTFNAKECDNLFSGSTFVVNDYSNSLTSFPNAVNCNYMFNNVAFVLNSGFWNKNNAGRGIYLPNVVNGEYMFANTIWTQDPRITSNSPVMINRILMPNTGICNYMFYNVNAKGIDLANCQFKQNSNGFYNIGEYCFYGIKNLWTNNQEFKAYGNNITSAFYNVENFPDKMNIYVYNSGTKSLFSKCYLTPHWDSFCNNNWYVNNLPLNGSQFTYSLIQANKDKGISIPDQWKAQKNFSYMFDSTIFMTNEDGYTVLNINLEDLDDSKIVKSMFRYAMTDIPSSFYNNNIAFGYNKYTKWDNYHSKVSVLLNRTNISYLFAYTNMEISSITCKQNIKDYSYAFANANSYLKLSYNNYMNGWYLPIPEGNSNMAGAFLNSHIHVPYYANKGYNLYEAFKNDNFAAFNSVAGNEQCGYENNGINLAYAVDARNCFYNTPFSKSLTTEYVAIPLIDNYMNIRNMLYNTGFGGNILINSQIPMDTTNDIYNCLINGYTGISFTPEKIQYISN